MVTWLLVLIDFAIAHYTFSFQRFTLKRARADVSGRSVADGQIALTPTWMGVLSFANYFTLVPAVYLLWTKESWMWAVGYVLFRFVGSALVPLLPWKGHFGRLAGLGGTAQDDAEAARCFRMAADQGDGDAQLKLSCMYREGRGVRQDYTEAAKWSRKAAEQGNASAQNDLGVAYHCGLGVPQDYEAAVKWYRKAAEQSELKAQINLGLLYGKLTSEDECGPKDYVAALMWLSLAASHSSGEQQKQLFRSREAVAKKLTAQQIAEAERRGREWKPNTSAT